MSVCVCVFVSIVPMHLLLCNEDFCIVKVLCASRADSQVPGCATLLIKSCNESETKGLESAKQ